MLRVNRRLDYGLTLMIALANDAEGKAQPTSVLAEKLKVPLPFLHQIGHALMQAKLIKASPGPHGGIRLSRPAEEITLLDIVETLEGSVNVVPCPDCQDVCPVDCDKLEVCYSRLAWLSLQKIVTKHLSQMRLSEVAKAETVEELLSAMKN